MNNNDNCSDNKPPEDNTEQCETIASKLEGIRVALENLGASDEVIDSLNDVRNFVGAGYPATVPVNLADKRDSNVETIEDLPSHLSYLGRQIVNLIGCYPQEIIDKTNENRHRKVSFPNVAETLSEIAGMNFQQVEANEYLMRMMLSMLAEQVSTNKMLVQLRHQVDNITDFLSFKIIEKEESMPIPITLGKDTIEESLKPSEIKIPIEDFDSDGLDWLKQFKLINTMYAILKATSVHDREEIDGIIDEISEDSDSENLRSFIEKVERGFIDETVASERINPYGKRYDRRPRLRILDGSGASESP